MFVWLTRIIGLLISIEFTIILFTLARHNEKPSPVGQIVGSLDKSATIWYGNIFYHFLCCIGGTLLHFD